MGLPAPGPGRGPAGGRRLGGGPCPAGSRGRGAGSASAIAGYVILAILVFLGAVPAFKTLGLETVSTLAEQLLAGLFNIVAVVIFGVGLFLSRVAYKTISPSGEASSALLGNVARIAILVLTGAMALSPFLARGGTRAC